MGILSEYCGVGIVGWVFWGGYFGLGILSEYCGVGILGVGILGE